MIDDRLPIRNEELAFAKTSNSNEFWISLLEKAYAKFRGSYKDLESLFSLESVLALTGGIVQNMDLMNTKLLPNDLFSKLNQEMTANKLCICVVKVTSNG